MTETLPWQLGTSFHIGVAVLDGGDFRDATHRFRVHDADPAAILHHARTWAQIGSFRREGRNLIHVSASTALHHLEGRFANGIQLAGYRYQAQPDALIVVLAWRTEVKIEEDYTVFVHLVTSDGHRIAQSDAQPHWAATWPTRRWQPGEWVLDGHKLNWSAEASYDDLHLEVGLYLWPSLQRLPVLDTDGQPSGDHIEIPLALPAP